MGGFPGGLSIVPPTPNPKKLNDDLVKDDKESARAFVKRHGWTGPAVYEAVGVMGAESSFDPSKSNPTPCSPNGDHAIGLFAMCTVHAGKFGIPIDREKAVEWLKDPDNNADAAFKLYTAAGMTFGHDWVTYQNGAWKKFRYQNPLITTKKHTATGIVGDTVDKALGPLDEIVTAVLSPSTWFRVGKGIAGWNLILLGAGTMVYLASKKAYANPTVNKTVKLAAKGTPVGKVVK